MIEKAHSQLNTTRLNLPLHIGVEDVEHIIRILGLNVDVKSSASTIVQRVLDNYKSVWEVYRGNYGRLIIEGGTPKYTKRGVVYRGEYNVI